MAVAIKQVCSY